MQRTVHLERWRPTVEQDETTNVWEKAQFWTDTPDLPDKVHIWLLVSYTWGTQEVRVLHSQNKNILPLGKLEIVPERNVFFILFGLRVWNRRLCEL